MKIRYYRDLKEEVIPGLNGNDGPIFGKTLVIEKDKMGFVFHEIRPQYGHRVELKSPDSSRTGLSHMYFFMDGEGQVETFDRAGEVSVNSTGPGILLALPPAAQAAFTPADHFSRVAVIQAPSSSGGEWQPMPALKSSKELLGGERDVDWGRGTSLRYLLERDGYSVTVTNTVCRAGHTSELCYRNNVEAAYCVSGDVRYEWDSGRCEASFKQHSVRDGDAMMIILDQHDPHTLHALSQDCAGVCVFNPPLKGSEIHKLSTEGFSTY